MKKMMKILSPMVAMGCMAAVGYLYLTNKKNMLDVIIEEIETIR